MEDQYKQLRGALENNPTQYQSVEKGRWFYYRFGSIHTDFTEGYSWLKGDQKDFDYIAAANPDTVRALLAERDVLEMQVKRLQEVIRIF